MARQPSKQLLTPTYTVIGQGEQSSHEINGDTNDANS